MSGTTENGPHYQVEKTQRWFQNRCYEAIRWAILWRENTLIDALMTLGKTFTAGTIATDVPCDVTVLTRQIRTREDIKEEAEEADLDVKILPRFDDHCPTARGDHGGRLQRLVTGLRNHGVNPSDIHRRYPDLPCQDSKCPYSIKADFNPEDYDVIIGHPLHSNVTSYIEGRAVLMDESAASAFEEELDATALSEAVHAALKAEESTEVNNLQQLREADEAEQQAALDAVTGSGDSKYYDPTTAFDNLESGRADTARLIAGLVEGEVLDPDGGSDDDPVFERVELDDGSTVVFEQNEARMVVRTPPDFQEARCVVGLDGTPVPEIWRNRLGLDLDHQRVLSDEERQEYILDILGYDIYQTTDATKPYASGNHVSERKDRALLEGITRKEGEKPSLISTRKAEFGVPSEFVAKPHEKLWKYYGKIRSSNEMNQSMTHSVLCSNHPGDYEIQTLAALDGQAIYSNGEKGADKSYGSVGDRYYRHYCHNEVAQAIFRAGRDGIDPQTGDGANIYVDTCLIPDWVPVTKVEGVVRVRHENERHIMRVLDTLGAARTARIANEVDVSKKTARKHLRRLEGEGVVTRHRITKWDEWEDDGLAEAPRYGVTELRL